MKKSKFSGMFQKEIQKTRIRTQDNIFVAEMYCDNPDCNLREIVITIKELFEELNKDLKCPACSQILKTHSVESLSENTKCDRKCLMQT